MRVILDTNILISALLSVGTPPDRIYNHWRAKGFDLVTCPEQMEEIRRVSRYPKFRKVLQPHRVGQMMNFMQASTMIDDLRVIKEADDPSTPGSSRSPRHPTPTIS
ncbi:MAG: putative toxin-antitoxin system toxin component, PIN family [Thermomicrobiales bacterium]